MYAEVLLRLCLPQLARHMTAANHDSQDAMGFPEKIHLRNLCAEPPAKRQDKTVNGPRLHPKRVTGHTRH